MKGQSNELDALADMEVEAMARGDVDAYLALLDEEAVFLPPGLLPKEGAELHNWMRQFLTGFTIEWIQFTHDEAYVCNDYGYHRYTYKWRFYPKSGGEEIMAQGKGLHIMRRRAGGSWKLYREIWNANPA